MAGDDRVCAVEGKFAAAIRGRHPNVFQNLIGCGVQVDIRAAPRVRELGLNCLGEQIRLGLFWPQRRFRGKNPPPLTIVASTFSRSRHRAMPPCASMTAVSSPFAFVAVAIWISIHSPLRASASN